MTYRCHHYPLDTKTVYQHCLQLTESTIAFDAPKLEFENRIQPQQERLLCQ